MLRSDLGEFIKSQRLKAFISQEELAFKADVTVRTVYTVEAGNTEPHFKTLRKIGDALGIAYEDFLDHEAAR